MAQEGCSATRCRRARIVATLTAALNTFGSSARRSGLAGVLLASTASLSAADAANAPVAPFSGDFSRTQRKLTGYVMTDSTIGTAVAAWLSDSAAAEATYGHISTWETGGVTDMTYLFSACDWDSRCNSAAASFNEDIGAWDTSGVMTMYRMFYEASSFNQDIGGWAVHSVTDMSGMFYEASAFDQNLGWCVGDDVVFLYAFDGTSCESTSCGVLHTAALSCGGTPMGDRSIRTAVAAWLSDSAAAEATYGHISTWETSGVTDMSYLFCAWAGHGGCNTAAASFNEDISAWDTSGVTDMRWMFYKASAFDQDLGWCVDDDVSLDSWGHGAFDGTPCESMSCGIGNRALLRCGGSMGDRSIRTAVAAWLSDSAAAEATYGHISTWETGGGHGHVVFVLRAAGLYGRLLVPRRLRLIDVVLQRGHWHVGHLWCNEDVRNVLVRLVVQSDDEIVMPIFTPK